MVELEHLTYINKNRNEELEDCEQQMKALESALMQLESVV